MVARDADTNRDEAASEAPAVDRRPARSAPADTAVRTVAAAEILGASGMLRIDLDGEIYTLRLTRNHRLILTK
jgi:hemin uptake protein HemP